MFNVLGLSYIETSYFFQFPILIPVLSIFPSKISTGISEFNTKDFFKKIILFNKIMANFMDVN